MKTAMIKIGLAALLCTSAAFGALAEEYTKGIVNKVDTKAKKVTIKHEDLKNLDMPAMTMTFRVKDPAWLAKLQPGEKVSFTADKVDGQLTVLSISPK